MPALPPVLKKSRPGLFRLADEDHVGQVPEIVLANADPGTADHGERAAAFQFAKDFPHPCPLHVHARQADDVRLRDAVVVDRLDVFVDERHLMLVGCQRGQQRQASGRHTRPLAQERQGMLQAPIRNLESRIDEHDLGHDFSLVPRGVKPRQSQESVAHSTASEMSDKRTIALFSSTERVYRPEV